MPTLRQSHRMRSCEDLCSCSWMSAAEVTLRHHPSSYRSPEAAVRYPLTAPCGCVGGAPCGELNDLERWSINPFTASCACGDWSNPCDGSACRFVIHWLRLIGAGRLVIGSNPPSSAFVHFGSVQSGSAVGPRTCLATWTEDRKSTRL